jgi:malonyl CoA-acyl carrier protein transacylase/acyl carrier protein
MLPPRSGRGFAWQRTWRHPDRSPDSPVTNIFPGTSDEAVSYDTGTMLPVMYIPIMAKIAHVFPGQGAFFAGALRRARFIFLDIEDVVSIVEAVAHRRFGRSLVTAMWDDRNDATHLMKTDPGLLQLAIFAVSVAAHQILRGRGVEPSVLMGHSFGEIAALTCAGVVSIEQGAEIVCDRVESLAAAGPRDGSMAAVATNSEAVSDLLKQWASDRPATSSARTLTVAVENHDNQTVVSGPDGEVAEFIAHCKVLKLSAQKLLSPYGFHHSTLAPVATAFAARLTNQSWSVPKLPVYSPIMGRYYRPDDSFGDCLARHLVMPVAFGTAVRRLHAEGVSVYVECGALDGLTRIIGRILDRDGTKTFPTFTPDSADGGCFEPIVNQYKENQTMNAPLPDAVFPEFEAFWNERGPFVLALIKSEFTGFLMRQRNNVEMTPVSPLAPPAPAEAEPVTLFRRDKLFLELVAVYAEAMEYPPEVFTETVELEAELGIDSVKQTEILGRISETYALPKLPANVRLSDFKTMGDIVDLVFANKGKAAVAV